MKHSPIPGKTLRELKEEAKRIGQKIEKDKKIFEKYLIRQAKRKVEDCMEDKMEENKVGQKGFIFIADLVIVFTIFIMGGVAGYTIGKPGYQEPQQIKQEVPESIYWLAQGI